MSEVREQAMRAAVNALVEAEREDAETVLAEMLAEEDSEDHDTA